MPFDAIIGICSSMRAVEVQQIAPLTAYPQNAANVVINSVMSVGWPTDSWSALVAIQSALGPLYELAGPGLESLPNPVNFTVDGGITWDVIDVTMLHDELDAIIAACEVLE